MEIRTLSSVEDAKDLLRTWREDVVRRSDDVISIWDEILSDTQSELGDERWMILEQVLPIKYVFKTVCGGFPTYRSSPRCNQIVQLLQCTILIIF